MSVIVFSENWKGEFRKSSYEAVSYASETAKILGTDVIAVSFGDVSENMLLKLGLYGASKIISVPSVYKADGQVVTKIISDLSQDSSIFVFSGTHTARMIAPRLSINLKASYISNVISLTDSSKIIVKRKSFSSKAIELVKSNTSKSILCISPNSFGLIENKVECVIEQIDIEQKGSLNFDRQETSSGKISISEAEIVVSAGRGLKGPENWGMIEELADVLGAATACSKPVSDIGWRPHSEHVGQTGKPVAADLYIAIGISGAIQHLAGVSSSKVMVAINTDPEAPFFKAADYGIVGDAFEVVPKLIEEIKQLKN